jgi:hypothetical protein
MTHSIRRWMMAAAALAMVAGSASAQTYLAEIPLRFHVRNQLMQPGRYEIVTNTVMGGETVRIFNVDTKTPALLMAGKTGGVPAAWRAGGDPVLVFECVENSCALRRMWNGQDQFSYEFPRPARAPSGEVRLAVVTMTPVKAD